MASAGSHTVSLSLAQRQAGVPSAEEEELLKKFRSQGARQERTAERKRAINLARTIYTSFVTRVSVRRNEH